MGAVADRQVDQAEYYSVDPKCLTEFATWEVHIGCPFLIRHDKQRLNYRLGRRLISCGNGKVTWSRLCLQPLIAPTT